MATIVGLDEVRTRQSPGDKVATVRDESSRGVTVMVGDGINDAPALAAATVGVALGARGSTASSEAADVILTTDHVDTLADVRDIARRSRQIAVQSAAVGMSLSVVAMVIAAVGLLPVTAGALLQECIDVAVILNALRALTGPGTPELPRDTTELISRFAGEHDRLRSDLRRLRECATAVAHGPDDLALRSLRETDQLLVERIEPHESAEESLLYPALGAPLGGDEATATMSRAHAEIHLLSARIAEHRRRADAAGSIEPGQVDDLLACLYGLHAILTLHFAEEEENYFTLLPS